jgi:DNA-binding beta-propeller fold protein YncE
MPAPRPDVNVYAHIADPNPNTAGALFRVYVPHEVSGYTDVIDPTTMKVIDTFTTGPESQHVVPSYDMKTLYVVSGRGNRLTPIDPTTGKPGAPIPVADPYNLYYTPDGSQAIVVAEGEARLDFRDPHTFALHDSVQTDCAGLNHLDYSADLTYFIATCEFDGGLIKFDLAQHKVVAKMKIDMTPSGHRSSTGHAQPQDIRLSSDGTVFFVADLQSAGLYVIDGDTFRQVGYIPTGIGTHSLYPSRDGRTMYVINRGTPIVGGPPHGQGSVAVLDPYTRSIGAVWPIPGGGSPDMGNITADGTQLWLGGRYDREVYVFDLVKGGFLARIPVGINPHGLTVWPQPGRFSLGHTGNQR